MLFTMLKIAVFAPMPRARVETAMIANPGFFNSIRAPYRVSCHSASISPPPRIWYPISLMLPTLPKFRSAASRASSGFIPRSMLLRVSASTCSRISSSMSSSTASRRKSPRRRAIRILDHFIGSSPTCWFRLRPPSFVPADLVTQLLDSAQVAKCPESGKPCLVQRHPTFDVGMRLHIDMNAHFLFNVLEGRFATEESSLACPYQVQPLHMVSCCPSL